MADEYRGPRGTQVERSSARAANTTDTQQSLHDSTDAQEYPAEAAPFIALPRDPNMYSYREPETGGFPYPRYEGASAGASTTKSRIPGTSTVEVGGPTAAPRSIKPLWRIWWLEMISIVLGFAALALIVAVLAWFDQQSLPNWPSQITLNTFVAFFTTLGKAAFMFPIPKAISSSQWTWFGRDRQLYDLHVFDQASRGAWGSMVLLYRLRFRHFAALGAVLMAFSFLTSPITQLAISYPMREVPATTGEAKALAIRTIDAPKDRLDLAARKAITLSTVVDGSHFRHPIEPLGTTCTTGNCTFDTYQSLGICMRTANITSHLQIQGYSNVEVGDIPLLGDRNGTSIIPEEPVWNASLGSGYDMLHQAPLSLVTDMLNGDLSFGFADDKNLMQSRIASFILIYAAPVITDAAAKNLSTSPELAEELTAISSFHHEAVEILYHVCGQTWDSEVYMGTEKNRVISEVAEPVGLGDDAFLDMNCQSVIYDSRLSCATNPNRWDEVIHLKEPAGSDSTLGFSANYRSMEMMASALKNGLAGYARAQYHPKYYPNADVYNYGDLVQTLFQEVIYSFGSIRDETHRNTTITNFYLNIATSMSSVIRLGQPEKFTQSGFNITGQAWTQAPYVQITWGWLAFLAAELFLAVVFLAVTMISQAVHRRRSARRQDGEGQFACDIKDSSLAPLVVLSEAGREVLGVGVQPVDTLKRTAKDVRVRLVGNELVPVAGKDSLPPVMTGLGIDRA